jgi:hypothetical protein
VAKRRRFSEEGFGETVLEAMPALIDRLYRQLNRRS